MFITNCVITLNGTITIDLSILNKKIDKLTF